MAGAADKKVTSFEPGAITVPTFINVGSNGDDVIIAVTNPRLTPKGGAAEKDLITKVDSLSFGSGIMDSKDPDCKGGCLMSPVKGNHDVFIQEWKGFLSAVKKAKIPFAEHAFAQGNDTDLYLVLDPNDILVICEMEGLFTKKCNPETLAIGWLTCPDGGIFPLKSIPEDVVKKLSSKYIKNAKILQGAQPELAGYCKAQAALAPPAPAAPAAAPAPPAAAPVAPVPAAPAAVVTETGVIPAVVVPDPVPAAPAAPAVYPQSNIK